MFQEGEVVVAMDVATFLNVSFASGEVVVFAVVVGDIVVVVAPVTAATAGVVVAVVVDVEDLEVVAVIDTVEIEGSSFAQEVAPVELGVELIAELVVDPIEDEVVTILLQQRES